jgi:hypothetical protein
MKKIFALIMLAGFIGSNIYSHNNFVVNETDGTIAGSVKFAGAGVCATKSFSVPKGEKKKVYSGICCGRKYEIWSESGEGVGMGKKTQEIGFPKCRSQKIIVKKDANGEIVLESKW